MATAEGDLSRTLESGHQSFFDFPCSLCEDQGKHVEATKYCEECFVYMCDNCMTSVHNRIPLNTRHKLLDQDQFPDMSQSTLKSFPTRRCLKHPGELINIFCGNHDVVCCSVCKALDHRYCAKTHHLPDAAKGIQTSHVYRAFNTETKVVHSDVLNAIKDRTRNISRIAKEKQKVKQAITDFRKRVNKYFDDLEQKTLHELDLIETKIVITLEQDKKILDQAKRGFEDIMKQLDSYRGDNECEIFCHVKTSKTFVHDSMKIVHSISSSASESIVFKLNADIEKYLSSIVTIGSVAMHVALARHSSVSSAANTRSALSSALPWSHVLPGKFDHFTVYETQLIGSINVKDMFDNQNCKILDMCQTTDGNMLLNDLNNKKVKLLDQSYKLINSLQLLEPAHICVIGSDEAAVSVCSKKKFEFVSVGNKMSVAKSVNTGSYCRGMVYKADKLYVCCCDHLDSFFGFIEVYNNAGQLQYSIPSAPQRLPVVPKHITVSDDGQHLLVTCSDTDNISMLDLAGNVVGIFSCSELKLTTGICTDGTGQVFVCGFESNTVVQFSPKQKKFAVILTEADGVLHPRKAYYDRRMSRLSVACDGSNELLIFSCKLN